MEIQINPVRLINKTAINLNYNFLDNAENRLDIIYQLTDELKNEVASGVESLIDSQYYNWNGSNTEAETILLNRLGLTKINNN